MISILFENPKSDVNVENIARTCDFFGVDFYVSSFQKVKPKISAGVLKHKPLKVIDISKWQGRINATGDSFTSHPKDFKFQDGDLLVFGNESIGISQQIKQLAHFNLGIQSKGIVPCLNVANAVAVFLGIIDLTQP